VSARPAALVAALVALGLGTSCLTYRGPRGVREQLESQMGVELDREFGIKLGFLSTKLASGIARMASDEPLPLRGISGIGVVTYNLPPSKDREQRSLRELKLDGWETLLRVRDHGDDATVLARMDGEHIRGLLFVVKDDDEVTIAKIRGRLERMLETAINQSLEGRGPGAIDDLARSR
jgi:hypothetical protein